MSEATNDHDQRLTGRESLMLCTSLATLALVILSLFW